MKSCMDCIPCFVRQSLDAARFVSENPTVHEFALRQVLSELSEVDLDRSPPETGQAIHRIIRNCTGVQDPYKNVKQRSNEIAFALYPELKARVEKSEDSLETAARLAIAGNIIDFAIEQHIGPSLIVSSAEDALTAPISCGAVRKFREAVDSAERILYLADNAGEIVFDRLLTEQMPTQRITLAVRGAPVLNDATMLDAKEAGLTDIVDVIDNGSDAPGTVLHDCSKEFVRRFHDADLVVSKGQGNYETLSHIPKRTFYLLKVKCPVIEWHSGYPVGSLALIEHVPEPHLDLEETAAVG